MSKINKSLKALAYLTLRAIGSITVETEIVPEKRIRKIETVLFYYREISELIGKRKSG